MHAFCFWLFFIFSVFRDESRGLLAIHVVSGFIFAGLSRLASKLKRAHTPMKFEIYWLIIVRETS